MMILASVAIVIAVLAYTFVGGYVGTRFYAGRFDRCADCRKVRNGDSYSRCFNAHGATAGGIALAWPIALPMTMGSLAADREAKASRRERKHERQLEILNAERSLAHELREKTLADIAFLAENGIKAEVPGLYEERS